MKHVTDYKEYKNFPLLENLEPHKILLVDCSASITKSLVDNMEQLKMYLGATFTAIVDYDVKGVYENTTIQDLINRFKRIQFGGGSDVQKGINYIIQNQLQGSVLLITDGEIPPFDITGLSNQFSILTFDVAPTVKGGNYQVFKI